MQHDDAKELQEASLVGRILSLEAALLLMGIVSFVYGLFNGTPMSIFWGAVIISVVFVLHKVRKIDWKSHWKALEEKEQQGREPDTRE